MKKSKFGKRVLAFVLVFVMVMSLLPLNIMAAKLDIATGTAAGETGIQEDTLNKNGTINWPIKIYDYLADGMLFEFAQADGSVMYSSNKGTTDDYSGQYVLGKPMPPIGVGHDFTADYTYTTGQYVNSQYSTETNRYVKTKMAAVNYQSPQYMRITSSGRWLSNFSSDMNCCIANFPTDNGGAKKGSDIRYMVLVYRSNGINDYGSVPAFKMNVSNEGLSTWNQSNALVDVNGNKMTNSANWRYIVIDIQKSYDSNNWSNMNSGTPVHNIYIRLVQDSTSDYFDLSHIAFFSNPTTAAEFGEQALEFIREPGEYVSGTYWNGSGNDAFGMLHPSNGAAYNTGGGNPITSTNGGNYAGYYTHSIGYRFPEYYSSASTYNSKRLNGKDANGRYNGSGSEIGNSNYIYYMMPYTYYTSSGYQAKHPNATSFDMSEIKFDGYSLLTTGNMGVWTAGLLEGQLGADGTPVYRQEAVEYIADVLSKTLVIPQKAENGRNNYAYVAGVKNREQYGYSVVNGKEVANDLAQGLRNCLEIHFTGNTKADAPVMGTYADTLAKADKLKGAFLAVAPNIDTCMDAAYYLLNNIFVANSYNQEQDDYRYLTLSSAKLDNGQDAYVFDGGFSNGASLADLESGKITQTQYKDRTNSAVVYNGFDSNGDGTISLNTVNEKDLYYYTSSSTTTRYPFLPVTDAEGVYAGETDSYYFAEDGKRSYDVEYGTYKNRNYNYVLESNGEFVYHEEDNLFFEFEGDDDVYLFINGQLVLDLGGGHSISNSSFNVNDYVVWARDVLKNPTAYSDAEIARAEALSLENGEIASFDFYYMERHGFGANMRIVTNMHITDPKLRTEKTAYQSGKQIEFGDIVDPDKPIEYNFKISNVGTQKLYNLTFDDSDIGVSLTPEKGLFVAGDDTASELDNINGYYVTDARGGRLDAEDLTAVVTGYQNVGTGGNYIQSGHTYTKVADGAGTHIYYPGLTVNFKDNEDLKYFLKTLQSEHTDNEVVDEELTQKGSGLWVDADVTFKGIYYTMEDEHEDAGVFENTVYVTASIKPDMDDEANEVLRGEARHRVYVTAIPSYYQWAGHDLFISKLRVTTDAAAESSNESSLLHDYKIFFDKVGNDISKFGTKFCDRAGNVVPDNYYPNVSIQQAKDGNWGYVTTYPESGIYEFHLLMYLYGASGLPSDLSTLKASDLNLGDYAVVRVLIIVTDVEDSEYVLDYGLSTENLDANGELFKNDQLFGSLSGTQALLMGVTNKEPSYLNYNKGTEYNRIDFAPLPLSTNNKVQTEDGYYKVNLLIPENGRQINYNEISNMYTLTETGTVKVHVDCPAAWKDLYLYYWYDDGRNNFWPGEKMSNPSHGNFELNIPSNVPHIILSNGTNQTVDLHLNTGQDVWVDIPGTLNAEEKLYATTSYKSADGVLHTIVPEGWGDVYVYCWDTFGNGLVKWPGTKVEEVDENGYFTFNIPGDITNVIVNNGDKGKQTEDLVVFAGSETWIEVNDTVVGENTEIGVTYYGATASRSTETVTMHASVPKDWEGAALYYWNSNGSATGVDWPGIPMIKGDDGQYHIDNIPADVTNVIINDGKQDNAKQTHNLTISSGVETWFNVFAKSGEGDTKVVAQVPVNWSNAYVYFFKDGAGDVGAAWPGAAATKVSDGVFTIDAPEGATHYIVNNNNGQQTQNLKLILGATNNIEFYSDKNARPVTDTQLHIESKRSWENAYVHYWYKDANGVEHGTTWPGEAATKNDDGTFSFTIPAGYNKFIINDYAGSQTPDITEFFMGIENHVTIYEDNNVRIGMPYETEIVYGENAEKEGITFTPTDFMDSYYSIWMALTVHQYKVDDDDQGDVTQYLATPLGSEINIAKEVQMYKKITVLPATVVYYEDDFAGIKYNTTGENVITHYGQGSGSLSQSVDQNQEYGQDNAYQGSENDEITGGSLTDVKVNKNEEFASFEFTGTGFEIIGHTHAVESGTVRVVVKDKAGNIVAQKAVITEFDNGADGGTESIVAVPIIRFSGLEFGTYTVTMTGVPVYDFDNWASGAARPPVLTAYICIDGVRIYQPLNETINYDRENIVSGMTYEAEKHGTDWHANLTDGVAPNEIWVNNTVGGWFGFHKNYNASEGYGAVTFDLECDHALDTFRMHLSGDEFASSIAQPMAVEVYVAEDGGNYKFIGNLSVRLDSTTGYWAELELDEAIEGRKVRFLIYNSTTYSWVFLNEIEVYGKVIGHPVDVNKNPEKNLALGAAYTAKPYTNSTYIANLTDGKYDTTFQNGVNDSAWFAFKNTGDSATGNIDPNNQNRAVFTMNLDAQTEVKKISFHHYRGVGADSFTTINVYASVDGVSYPYIGTINPDSSQSGAHWVTLDLSSAPVEAKYLKFALSAPSGKTVLVNEIEVYGRELLEAGRNDAYLPTENGSTFTEIRNLIAEREAFAIKYDDTDGLSVSGGTSTWIENRNNSLPSGYGVKWTSNVVNSVADYLLAGPNNEVYMLESTEKSKTALAFYVQEDDSAVHNMQIAVRALDYGSFIGSQETGKLNAEIQYGALVDGVLVWKTLATTVSSAEQYYTIPYTECPYDADNNRYQVVIRVGDTDVTGMASFTTIKLNGLDTLMLNEEEIPDKIVYADDINNTIIDSKGNTLDSAKFFDFIKITQQMNSNIVMYSTGGGQPAPEGVNTSELGVLYDSFTADSSTDFVLTADSKIFIVTASESAKPSDETIETAQLVQSQLRADNMPSSDPLDIVWGLEKYVMPGDIVIYADASGLDAEEFKLVVTDTAKIYAADDSALLYGLNTLQKHFRYAGKNAIEGFTMQDEPDTKERTLHLDVARKYQTVESVKNYIAEISWMGYNALELHFSEDGGFRMDFWGDTALSQVPGMTGNDFSWVCGSNPAPWVFEQFQDTADKGKYLTTEEVIEICRTAKQYNIEVIPSFDTPAHVGYMTELYYNTVKANSNSPIRNFTYNGTTYTLPTQINYRNYTGSGDSRYDFSVLNLADNNVKNFAYAMYSDIAAFFKYYAGSTDFNIGADEVALQSTDVWTYTDFINYVNQVNAVLKNKGYRTRMYNDFLYNTNYSSATTGIDTDIDVVYWLPTTSSRKYLRSASFFADQGRTVYNGVNFWTYYVLRIAPTSTATHMDARDPSNRQWEFYRNQEDTLYNEWNATQMGAYTDSNMGAANNYSGNKLGGGYFMIWNDFAGLNTEVEVWNGCTDIYGKYSNGSYSGYGYYYSMIERMWSSGIKQWNADINSTLTFANFETLRDKMGFFPGYVATNSSQAYANGFVLATPTEVDDEAYRSFFTVTFVDHNGKVLSTQDVKEGYAATAPADPSRPMDVWYTYTFTGWDKDFSNITEDMVVTAQYSQQATTAGKIGYLEIKVSGGTNFNMSVDGAAAKPMGVEYVNPSMEFGKLITVTSKATNGNKFIGWMDAKNGEMLSTSETYTFFTSGNDVIAAIYDAGFEDMGVVTFRNDKTNQIIDIQYYSSTDTIEFPAAPSYPGYKFIGWQYSETEIKDMLSQGMSVTVNPTWATNDVYFAVDIVGGTITKSAENVGGKYPGYKSIEVLADEAPAGKWFAYWIDQEGNILSYEEEYKFYPFRDTTLTAVFISNMGYDIGITGTKPIPEADAPAQKDTITVYFENNWNWSDVRIHYWGASETVWPGTSMTFLEKNGEYDVYTFEVPAGTTGIIFNGIKDDGSGNRDQSPNITDLIDGRLYRMTWNDGNQVESDDSRIQSGTVTEPTVYSFLYIYAPEGLLKDGEWFAAHVWETENTSSDMWFVVERVADGIYKAKVPEKYAGIEIFKMVCSVGVFDTTGASSLLSGSIHPEDENNTVVYNADSSHKGYINIHEMFFVNELEWETIEVYYTDEHGTHKVELELVETDENGKDVYMMHLPENVSEVTFTNGKKTYTYTPSGILAARTEFGFVEVELDESEREKDVTINVGMDTESLGDSDIVVFDWSVTADTGNTFVNVGLLLVREEDYVEANFVKGTIDPNVIQFTPAKRFQTSVGIHSITIPQVKLGDGWVACAFVQYKDENGTIKTKYSKQVTGKK